MIGYLRREIHATQSASRDAGFLYLPGEDLSERVLDPQERGRTVLAVHAPRCTTAEVPGRERDAPEEEEKKDGRRGGARSEREYGLYVSCRPDPVRTPTGAGPHGVPKKKRPLPVAAARSPAPLLDFQPRRRPWGSGRGPIHVFYLPPELQEDLSVRRRVQLVRNHVPYNASFDYVMDTDLEGASDLFLGNRSI
mmetsp:Transcript_21608/g.49129  ORF Transcript_21608/g.49129 Transcript_21608/m.49129 type:complete len:194 (-) Transcript_21608:297-878(-)